MRKPFFFLSVLLSCVVALSPAFSQSTKGIISGVVKDSGGAVLQGAKIELQPQGRPISTNELGEFNIQEVNPGTYTLTVSYVGFGPYVTSFTVVAGQTAHVEAVLKVANASDDVIVSADRPHGEAEAINRTLAAENILQVLPADVIVSLPNANIADALGRMASVTIERDEGEGKYVQIRGTEPRLSNTMIDGVTVPSPETGVRQIKLDTIASDLVDSVEINKTLQANIDADGIGGSVNLVTKTAGEVPAATFYGVGGYTPIIGGRTVDQMGGTVGKRFGADKKLGLLLGGTYDFNGRGINDIEPSPTTSSAVPHYDSMDLRDYIYYRTRWGMTASADYKLREGSDISIRGLFSTFRNWGNKWVYTLNDGDVPQYSQDWRRPNMAVGSLALQGKHVFNASTVNWSVSAGRSRSLSGSGSVKYSWVGDPNIDCTNVPGVSVNRPGWSSGCFGPGADNSEDPNNYKLKAFAPPTFGKSAQVNLQASASYARFYHIGTHFGTIEFGGKIRSAHKFDDTYDESFTPSGTTLVAAHPEWDSDFTDPNYYDKTYHYGPVTDYNKVESYVNHNAGGFTLSGGPGVNPNNYDFVERIPAGYVMNTIELGSRLRLVTGIRFEATHLDTLSFDPNLNPAPTTLTFKAGGDSLDVLPSASLRFAVDKDSDLRLVYGRGLARPDPQDVTAAVGQPDITTTPATVSIGNPNLKAEYANNYDILYERSFNNAGLLQAGYFYKDISNPIVTLQTLTTNYKYNPGAPTLVSEPSNAGSAHVQGIEVGFQQRFSYLPGAFRGAGLSANYSYTNSQANEVDPLRTDSPAMLRQAPNSWNISPTFDTKKFSMRVGMTFDDKMIYAYQYENLAYVYDDNGNPVLNPNGTQETTPNPQVNGVAGPAGDNYLYSHFQFDTQASYKLPWGFQVYGYGLNLNNEVFGFYNGSPQYVVQREYYHPTYAGGLRWTSHHE
ncbi:TonB-dependent receptor [Telmatobacter sp. DSM 110680]|uniref:TonB-dependent receptor n=1 Tax=Telmatobacter sp. DSM 110680 TaxID=3036704 RepID=A0AAU7DL25_9BACT